MKWVYKITYPNGKIYVGKDLTGNLTYFGSPDPKEVAKDFDFAAISDFTIRREILWFSETSDDAEVNRMEVQMILRHESNNPDVGYNRWPKFANKTTR